LQNRCAGLPSCELAACPLVQAREAATGKIVIDIPTVLDSADAINDLPGLIKFKRQLGQVVEIAVWMRAHHERNLGLGKPYFDYWLHWTHLERDRGWSRITLVGRFVECAGFVTRRQTFVHCRHTGGNRPCRSSKLGRVLINRRSMSA
jgi:hypothetical protein